MSFVVTVTGAFGDPEATFPNYPDHVSFDMTEDQRVRDLTLDELVREMRVRATRELPIGVEMKCLTIELTHSSLPDPREEV